MKSEASVIITAVTSLATAAIGCAVAFGADISDAQQKAMLILLGAVCSVILLLGPIIRTFVYSKDSVQQIRSASVMAGETNSPPPVVP